jgi:hypothetical protein
MKKMTWKNIVAGKLVAAACGACLFLFTLPAAHAGLINFDVFDTSVDDILVPDGYGNLQWDNFYTLNGVTDTGSGYHSGVISKNNVAYNSYGEPASIFVDSGSFKPVLGFFTAAWNDNLQLEIKGYLNGRLVFNKTYTLSATKPTPIVFGVRVDTLDFRSYGGTHHNGYGGSGEHFAMDSFIVNP